MSATRTQIYLTERQRRRLEDRQRREGKSMAAVIRDAIDAYLTEPAVDLDVALSETFGSLPELVVPSRGEWAERDARLG
jgi:predicted DNA-binding protein